MPGSVSTALKNPMKPNKMIRFQDQRDVGIDAGATIVKQHEDQNGKHSHRGALMPALMESAPSDGPTVLSVSSADSQAKRRSAVTWPSPLHAARRNRLQ